MIKKGIIEYTRKEKGGNILKVKALAPHSQSFNGVDIYERLEKEDELRTSSIKQVKMILELNDSDLPLHIIDDIFSYAEFDTVIAALSSLKDWITSLEKKPTKNKERVEKAFIKKRDDFIKALKANNQYSMIEEIEKITYQPKKYYEDELYNSKQILYSELVHECKCAKSRAKNIIKILEEI